VSIRCLRMKANPVEVKPEKEIQHGAA